MITEIWSYFKKPSYTPYTDLNLQEKGRIFFHILALTVGASFILGLVMGGITSALKIELGAHGVEEMFNTYSVLIIFLIAVILAPLIEELLFRAPLALFKDSSHFKVAFYVSVLLFGVVHLSNFELFTEYLWLAPVLVAPQISAGIFLGFTRVKLGLSWAMLLHACHNALLLSPVLIFKILGKTIE